MKLSIFFMCLWASCISSLEIYLFKSFAHLRMWLSVLITELCVLYILCMKVPYQIEDLQRCSPVLCSFFTFLMIPFTAQKFLILMKYSFVVVIVACAFGVMSKKVLPNPRS